MTVGNFFVIAFLSAYSFSIFKFFVNKKLREQVIVRNVALDGMRKIPLKTLEEQKQFIDMKYPKKPKFKFSVKWLINLLQNIVIILGFFMLFTFLFNIFKIELEIWIGLAVVIVGTLIMNKIMYKLNLSSRRGLI